MVRSLKSPLEDPSRFIQVGDTLRTLVVSVAVRRHRDLLAEVLPPTGQMG
jgi:hypothetical protein